MADFNSKYSGEQVEQLLDMVAGGNAGGGGGGGITVETDPIFSASPAATITEAKIVEWDSKSAQGDKGDKGDKGDDGVGVASVAQTTTSSADGGNNVVTVTLTNGKTSTFTIKNGSKGSQGNKGDKGDTGTAGTNGTNGKDGSNGATFTPSVDANGNLSWANDKGLANPATVNIRGPKGDAGDSGGSVEETYTAPFCVSEINTILLNHTTIEVDISLIEAIKEKRIIRIKEENDSNSYILASYVSGDIEGQYAWFDLEFTVYGYKTYYIQVDGTLSNSNTLVITYNDIETTTLGQEITNVLSPITIDGGTPTISIDISKSIAKYVCYDPVTSLTVEEESQMPRVQTEIHISFMTASEVGVFDFPASWLWANGEATSIEPNTLYELSVVCTDIVGDFYWKATLIPFK